MSDDDFDPGGLAFWAETLANTPDVPEPDDDQDDDLVLRLRWHQIPRPYEPIVIEALFAFLDRIVPDDARHDVRPDGPEIDGFLRGAARKLLS